MTWQGGFSNPTVGPAQIQDGAVSSTKLADGAVVEAKLADLAVAAGKLQDEAVQNAKLADDSVSTAKVQDLAIVTAKIGLAAIGTAQIDDLAVTSAKIQDLTALKFRTAVSGERLEIDGTSGESFVRMYNTGGTEVGRMGYDPTGFGTNVLGIKNTSGIGSILLDAAGSIQLTAEGSAGSGVIVTNPDPQGGIPGKPFVVESGSGSGLRVWDSNSAATPTWAFESDTDTGIYNDSGMKFAVGGTGYGWISTAGDWRIGHISDTGKAFIRGSTAQVATAPTYSFQGDLDTGMYWKTTNQLAFATGGVLAMFIDHGQNMSMNGNILHTVLEARVDDGTSTNPSLTFNSDQDLGIYRKATNDIGLTSAGTVAHWRGNTTTNSGLASWRHNSFGGGSVYEWLPLTSSGKYKKNVKPASPDVWLNRLDKLQPVTYKSKAGADDGRRRFLGIVKEDAEQVWPNWTYDAMTVPLLMAIQDLRKRVRELESAAT